MAPSNLSPCPDCNQLCSSHAESCPHCGRFIQRFSLTVNVDRRGWAWTIGWSIVASGLIIALTTIAFWFLIYVLLMGRPAMR